jgi:UDP-N-acetylmuramoyl-tripeptide--D-alanyl-D-alanine ligase
MAEPGPGSARHHIEVCRLAETVRVRYLIEIGNADAGRLVSAATGGVEAEHVPNVAAALHLIRRRWAPDDVVLLNGSHDGGLQAVAGQLVEGGAPGRAPATRSDVACRSTAPSTCEDSA